MPARNASQPYRREEPFSMLEWTAHIQPIVALIAGILILIVPRLLNIIVAIYLILIGVVGLGMLK
jgi:hypothetical protein